MRHKITLLTAAVVLAFMAGLTPRAFAQSYETEHASKIMLPSAGNNPAYTLTLVANGLTGNNILKFPDGNGSGGTSILTNDGTGVLSWTAPGLSTISPGLAGQFLVTNGSTAVQWLGLQINSDFTGNGITSNLAIAQTSAAGADIIAALTANAGNITNGTTGNAATATTATTATTASNVVTNTVSDNTSYYPALLSSATGAASTPVDVGGTGLSYNPSTGTLTATNFSGTSLTSTGTTTIDNSGSNAVNIGSGGTYTGIISIGDSATGDVSTTNIKGNVTFSGPVTLPPGSVTAASLGLTLNNLFVGNSSNQASALAPTANAVLITGGSSPFQTPEWATTLPTGLTLNNETIGGTTSINTSGSITGGAGSFTTLTTSGLATLNTATVTNNLLVSGGARVAGNDTTGGNAFVTGYQTITGGQQVGGNDTVLGTLYANGNSNIDASPSSGGTVTIGNSSSTTTINGTITYANAPSLPLAKNDIFIGDATGATADTAMVTQDVSIISQSTHVAQATVNGSHATTFAVTNAETVGTTLGVSGLATLNTATVTNNLLVSGGARVAGNDTTGGNAFVTGYQTITGGQQVGGNDTVLGTFYANGNSNIDASPSSGGTVTIGNSLSTTTINGTITYANAPSLPLAKNDIFIGDATGATADTAMVTQDVTLQNTSTHVAQATVNGSHAATFAVTNAETVGTTLGVSGLATLNTATVTNNLLVSGGARVTGNDTTGGNAFVTGYQTITGGQQVGGNDTVLGTFYANGNSNIDASPSSGGTVTIGNSLSTTTINGTLNYANSPSLPLAKNDIFIGDATGATADTAMVTQDVSIISQSTHVAQATVNGSHAATFAVTNAETVGGTLTSSGNVSLDASPSSGGTVVIGNSAGPSTTTINGALNITGTVTLPAGSVTSSSLGLAKNDIFIGDATAGTADTAMVTQDVTLQNTSTHVAQATVNGSHATTFAVTNAETVGTTLGVTGATTLGKAGPSGTSGVLSIDNSTNTNQTTIEPGTAPLATYIYQLPAQPNSLPTAGNVLTIGTPTGSSPGPYTVPLTWSPAASAGVTTFSAGSTGFTPAAATSGAITLAGTLISTNGGTGVSSPTAHDLLVAEGSTAMTPISGAAGTVLVGNGSSTDPSFSAVPTLGVPGTTAGTLTLASGAAAFSTTVQTSATTPASTYIYQLPAQPTGLPTAGNVLTIGTPTGTGPYTVPLTWTVPNSTTAVLYDQTTEQATIPISSTPATPSYLFNVGYNNTVVADSAAGAIINSVNTNTTAANAPLHNADGFTVNVTATGSGTFYGNATGLIVNATAPVGGIPTGVAVTIGGDTIGPAFQLHNKTQGSFYGARSIISTVDSDLEFKETGDKYGTSILDIQNRTGSNGALFQTISNAADTGTDVIDWGFIPGNGTQSNIRLEARHKWAVSPYTANEYLRSSANITSASPEEFQYFFGTTGATPLYTLSIGENATLLERGNFGIGYGTNSPGGDTAQGSPRVRLDVHSPGPYYGNLSDVGYSGASNILLSDTGTSSFTAPFVGAMEFQGTNDGISSFAAGAEASRYINYTWPTLSTAPTANQVLSISTISGSGTLATPYLAQLTWATASGSSTGVNFNVTTAQTAAVAANNYLFDVGYTNTAVDDSVVGAVITSTNTSTSNGGSSTSNHGATGLTVNATATSSTSFHGNSTAIFANATANTGGTATGLNLNVTGGTTDVDILGTAGWSVSSAGAATFAGITDVGATTINNTGTATTQIGNVAGFGNVTIGNVGTGAGSINLNSGTTGAINLAGAGNVATITNSDIALTNTAALTINENAANTTAGTDTKTALAITGTGSWTGTGKVFDGITLNVTGGTTNNDIIGTAGNWNVTSLGVMNLGGGTNTGSLQVNTTTAGIGTTSTDGIVLDNPKAGASGAPQWSPRIRLTGQDYSSSSHTDSWLIENHPGNGAIADTLVFSDNLNGAASNSADAQLTSGGTMTLGPSSGEEGALALGNSTNTNFTTIEAGAPTASITYILPTTAPSANQVLQSTAPSSGVATLSWTNNGSGGLSGLTTDGVLYAASSSTATSTSAGTAGQVLTSQGSGSAPTWGLPWRSGTATIASGNNSISVTMSSAFPGSPTDYKVTATFSKTGVNWGSMSSTVPIIEISSTRTSTVFTITTDNDSGGTVDAPTGGVTIDWIAIPSN